MLVAESAVGNFPACHSSASIGPWAGKASSNASEILTRGDFGPSIEWADCLLSSSALPYAVNANIAIMASKLKIIIAAILLAGIDSSSSTSIGGVPRVGDKVGAGDGAKDGWIVGEDVGDPVTGIETYETVGLAISIWPPMVYETVSLLESAADAAALASLEVNPEDSFRTTVALIEDERFRRSDPEVEPRSTRNMSLSLREVVVTRKRRMPSFSEAFSADVKLVSGLLTTMSSITAGVPVVGAIVGTAVGA